MSHTEPFDGELQYRQTTGQKQQSGGCNLGAVANATLSEPSLTTTASNGLGANNRQGEPNG